MNRYLQAIQGGMYFGEAPADIKEITRRKVRTADVEPATWTPGLLGRTYSAGYFVKAMREWGAAARAIGRFHQEYDHQMTIRTTNHPRPDIVNVRPRKYDIYEV